MKVTIKEVAQATGLSISTVSRALNNSGYVSHATRSRVEQAIAELGYHPNWMARSLKGKPSNLIGLIIPDISNVYYTAIARVASATLRDMCYELILCVSHEDPLIDLAYLHVLCEKRVDGILYVHPSKGDNTQYVRELVNEGIAVVELNRQSDQEWLDSVLADNRQGSIQGMRHLIEMGHQRIALIVGETNLETGSKRLAGYQEALHNAGLPVFPDLVKIGSFTRKHGEAAMQSLLKLPEPPTAVFAANNRILTGVLYVLGQAGICIPEDISVITFDDAEWLSIWNPPITVVDIAIDEIARLSVDLLRRRIQSAERPVKPITYILSTHLVQRASCQPPKEVLSMKKVNQLRT
jgi:LacI family transcriptional regulator